VSGSVTSTCDGLCFSFANRDCALERFPYVAARAMSGVLHGGLPFDIPIVATGSHLDDFDSS
jgi:hypothetical protein